MPSPCVIVSNGTLEPFRYRVGGSSRDDSSVVLGLDWRRDGSSVLIGLAWLESRLSIPYKKQNHKL